MRKATSLEPLYMGGIVFPKGTLFLEVEPTLYYHPDMLGGHSAGNDYCGTKYEGRLHFDIRDYCFKFKEMPPVTLENK